MQPDFAGLVLDGKYRLVAPLGTGGMGHVWRAEHVSLGRSFAVKLLRPELVSDPAALARFQQEAQAAARIGSRHIVEVFDVGRTPGGAPYLVMEFLRGRPLSAELAARGPLPIPRALDVVDQILDGLTAAHAAGIVHRDLKPDNVFLLEGPGGRDWVKIVDFGIAKAKDDPKAQHLTRTGMLLGTPRYMSPEQVLGRRDVDRRADLWAAGVILYECLTGRVPFEAADLASTLTAILQQAPVSPAALRPEVGTRLAEVVLRALAKDPASRFGDAAGFRAALAGAAPAAAAGGWSGPGVMASGDAAASVLSSVDAPLGGRVPDWSAAGGATPSWTPVPGMSSSGPFVGPGAGATAGGPGAVVVSGTARAARPPFASTFGPQAVPATAQSLAPGRPRVWPWLLAGLLVVGAAVAAIVFVATRSGGAAGAPAGADGGAPVAAGPISGGGTAPEDLPLEEQRERWLRIQTEMVCSMSREAQRTHRAPSGAETMDRWRALCAREGFDERACGALSMRLSGDAAATAELQRRVMQCMVSSYLAVDGGVGDAR